MESIESRLAGASRLLASDPAGAARQALAILSDAPGQPMALLILGASHNALGKHAEALEILEPLGVSQPGVAMVQMELGIALGQLRRHAEAAHALRRAVGLRPDLARAWLALGEQLDMLGDQHGAAEAKAWHARHANRDPALAMAERAILENQLQKAERLLRTRVAVAPADILAIRMLGDVAARTGNDDEASSLFQQALEIEPGFHAARLDLAMALNRRELPDLALVHIKRLLEVEPDNPAYRTLLAQTQCKLGDYAAGIGTYDGLLREFPHQPSLWFNRGHALKTEGRGSEAVQAYRRSIELEPGFGEAWWSLANLKTFRFTDEDIAAMRAQLTRPDLADDNRLHFEFALGKALEDRASFEESFAHYSRGNAVRAGSVAYSAAQNSVRARRAREFFTREVFASRAGSGVADADPIFVVGLPRAGSTLVEQILSSHSQVEGTMELQEIMAITRDLREMSAAPQSTAYTEVLATLDADALRGLGERYLQRTRIHRKLGKPFFIDKMP
ncbi:MAG: tetratricopeptide repeat protein, partial [Gammaproteobacteria bacterium]|nr:tetratricopeptide repeat protein [Gammaproteobacteria bacterium]